MSAADGSGGSPVAYGSGLLCRAAGARLAPPPAPAQAAIARLSALDAPLTSLEWSETTARLAAITSPGLVPFPSPNATVDPPAHRHR